MTIQIAREETRCRHMGYSFRLAARVHLYAQSHRQDSTYHGLCYASRGALAGTRMYQWFYRCQKQPSGSLMGIDLTFFTALSCTAHKT